MNKMDLIKQSVKKAEEQRKKLECGDVKFGMFPLSLFQTKMTSMMKQGYKKQDCRDAIVLYLFYLSHICRIPNHELQGCAFPSHNQIVNGTGIHRTRIKNLNDILVKEKMIEQFKIGYNGHSKCIYIPLYEF